ncbi:DNA ligase [Paenibacillus lemnae]|uniref:DNA ligase n=1 Tax=Paenibacillus lemnae TaxID=1330551 RepID=A0A848M7P5_PAELE|nr:DNA ligase [Paenibacillus lemnae]NMO96289.1 DNA ligase [Paenibacillus lemnae]
MEQLNPMSPLLVTCLPEGSEWSYQLKWDGFRILASCEEGQVQLFSKQMSDKTEIYPEITQALQHKTGRFVIDGEAVVLDPVTGNPSFQRMQQRDKLHDSGAIRRAVQSHPVHYMIFDLLYADGEDLRHLPFVQRAARLISLTQDWKAPLYRCEQYDDAEILWDWVDSHKFEGVIAKRNQSVYGQGKDHQDWFKRKTVHRSTVQIIGILMKEGRISSLVMCHNGQYHGRVSSGLNGSIKQSLSVLETTNSADHYFDTWPEGVRNQDVRWLRNLLQAEVEGRELTAAELLRHPRIISIEGVNHDRSRQAKDRRK